MGILHPRVRCPNCGGKIHTYRDYSVVGTDAQPLGGLSLTKTGTQCQLCGVPLTGRVIGKSRAEIAVAPVATPQEGDSI